MASSNPLFNDQASVQQSAPIHEPTLIVSVDTEEDEWGSYNLGNYEVANIQGIRAVQDLFDKYDVRPTYLVSYPVASKEDSISVLSKIERSGRCEIGAHCHPWNTPPSPEERNSRHSMLCNLPEGVQREKLRHLKEIIERNFGIEVLSFRAGRWGFGDTTARALIAAGFAVDSSITPHISWQDDFGPDHNRSFPEWYRIRLPSSPFSADEASLIEIPATIGFTGLPQRLAAPIHSLLNSAPSRRLKLRGLLARSELFNIRWLSPEASNALGMAQLSRRLLRDGRKILNLMFHSVTLMPGLTPFVKTVADQRAFLKRIEDYLKFARSEGIRSMTLSEAAGVRQPHWKKTHPESQLEKALLEAL